MKKYLMIMMAMIVAGTVAMAAGHANTLKKEMRVMVVKTTPEMHCQNCEKKIKENIRFEPGVRKIETSIERQEVTITYNPAKTDAQKLTAAFAKIGYDIKVLSDQPAAKKAKR